MGPTLNICKLFNYMINNNEKPIFLKNKKGILPGDSIQNYLYTMTTDYTTGSLFSQGYNIAYKESIKNNKGCILTNGQSDTVWWRFSDPGIEDIDDSAFVIIFVGSLQKDMTAIVNNPHLFMFGKHGLKLDQNNSHQLTYYYNYPEEQEYVFSSSPGVGDWFYITLERKDENLNIYYNGVFETSLTVTASNDICNYSSVGKYWGYLCELMTFRGELTEEKLNNIHAYIDNKWDITDESYFFSESYPPIPPVLSVVGVTYLGESSSMSQVDLAWTVDDPAALSFELYKDFSLIYSGIEMEFSDTSFSPPGTVYRIRSIGAEDNSFFGLPVQPPENT